MTERRFFLARSPEEGAPELDPEDARHLRAVLRLGPGDHLVGLDGRGAAWPLELRGFRGGAPELAPAGPPVREPAPGEPGAALPWVELWIGWPRAARAEPMVDTLVQLGAAALVPLAARGRGPEPLPAGKRLERIARIARAACKQSGRLWMPELREPIAAEDAPAAVPPGAALLVLDPRGEEHLGPALPEGATRERPLVLAVGPEGGHGDELAAWRSRGARCVRLHPAVLRVETAASAAMAVLAAAYHSRSRRDT